MNEERIDAYLRGLDDAAADYRPEWPDGGEPLDEWNAWCMVAGLPAGTLDKYLLELDRDE